MTTRGGNNMDGLSYNGNECTIERLEVESWEQIILEKIYLYGS